LPVSIHLPTLPETSADDSERAIHLVQLLNTIQRMNNPGFTWHFSLQGLPAGEVTCTGRELLPPVFTLTSVFVQTQKRLAVIFCGTICSRLAGPPAVHRVQCSVLSGLSSPLHQPVFRQAGAGAIARFAANSKIS